MKFEGDYLNDYQWNGIWYDIYNNIIYDFENGKGYVKLYTNKFKLSYEGEFVNGKRNGNGKIYS